MIYRNEHPNPGFKRENYVNLNGEWDFEFDFGKSGEAKGFYKDDVVFSKKINVPFCPESKLSGIEYKDFMSAVWYKRNFDITQEQLKNRVFVIFGAVDFHAVVYVNGEKAGEHFGGYTSFEVEVTKFIKCGKNTLTVLAEDDVRSYLQARGKQSEEYFSHDCDYTRTTGIWQTVYMETRPQNFIKSVKYYPNVNEGTFTVTASLDGKEKFSVKALWNGKEVGFSETEVCGQTSTVTVKLSEKHLWEVGKGGLYNIVLTFGEDVVTSYAGLREVALENGIFTLNGKPVFQRLVLDQGFYPDGIYTAPSKEALKNDIILSMKVGFNGARLHQKIFEPLFLHYADELGYLVWGEHGNWGLDWTRFDSIRYFLIEIEEEINRDFNHPSLIGWCPYNETWDRHGCEQDDDTLRIVYRTVKNIDSTRPCIDTSGNYHVETDIFDVHDYEQNPEIFKANYDKLITENKLFDRHESRQIWKGEPVFMSEYGGIKLDLITDGCDGDRKKSWGYGNSAKSLKEFYERYEGLTAALLDNPKMLGFCYTQLTDIEQEQNGIYKFDRTPKFDDKVLFAINTKKAAIEK